MQLESLRCSLTKSNRYLHIEHRKYRTPLPLPRPCIRKEASFLQLHSIPRRNHRPPCSPCRRSPISPRRRVARCSSRSRSHRHQCKCTRCHRHSRRSQHTGRGLSTARTGIARPRRRSRIRHTRTLHPPSRRPWRCSGHATPRFSRSRNRGRPPREATPRWQRGRGHGRSAWRPREGCSSVN